jgi:putative GTP pyrophosphokinase
MTQLKQTHEGGVTCDMDSVWRSQPETIKQFLDQRSDYEQLCIEVAYILRKRITTQSVEVALITQRAKTLNSFLEKIQRKKYDKPFSEIDDFAGVRVVCLYISDISKIEKVIQAEFQVVEKVDKFRSKAPDQFGYGAIHFVVRLGKKNLGARYDDLKDFKCEVQVRTVLQDAWAIIDHHLVYKRESDIPTHIQRKLIGLAGLLETADDQFDRIRQEREEYLDSLEKTAEDEPVFLTSEINRDSVVAYLERQFPSIQMEGFDGQLDTILGEINLKKYGTLQSIHSAIKPLFSHMERIVGSVKMDSDSGILRLALLLSMVDRDLQKAPGYPKDWIKPIDKLAGELNIGKASRTISASRREKPRA